MASGLVTQNAKPRVLVVEDEGIIARDIQKILQKLGYQVAGPAGTGAEALAEVDNGSADIVLMDIKIRGPIDGIETANQIRQRHRIPVVFLTAHADNNTLGRATRTDPYGYIVKPFTEANIKVAIEVALNRRRLERDAQARQIWLHAALESLTDAVIATGGEGDVEYLNQIAEELTGWSSVHARGRSLSELLHLEIVGNDPEHRALQAGRSTDRQIEFSNASIRTSNGERKPVVGSAGPLRLSEAADGQGLVMVLRSAPQPRAPQLSPTQPGLFKTAEPSPGLPDDNGTQPDSHAKLQELSYALSHDLREPVRNMACFAQMLSRQSAATALDAESQQYLRFIVEGSKRMDELLVGLFRYHSVNERPAPKRARADATAAWTEAAASLSENIRLSGARIQLSELPVVAMDFSSLKEIFESLLSNAIRFRADDSPSILAEAHLDGTLWRFTVSDNGVGLDAAQLERVFGLFKKAHRQGLSGAGVGLAVCRQLVELFGGRIWIESRIGEGARVHFTVPAAPDDGPQ